MVVVMVILVIMVVIIWWVSPFLLVGHPPPPLLSEKETVNCRGNSIDFVWFVTALLSQQISCSAITHQKRKAVHEEIQPFNLRNTFQNSEKYKNPQAQCQLLRWFTGSAAGAKLSQMSCNKQHAVSDAATSNKVFQPDILQHACRLQPCKDKHLKTEFAFKNFTHYFRKKYYR